MQFGSDWPGVFLRGDFALAMAAAVDRTIQLLSEETAYNERSALIRLSKTLRSCQSKNEGSGDFRLPR
jgi:hypothetical protein